MMLAGLGLTALMGSIHANFPNHTLTDRDTHSTLQLCIWLLLHLDPAKCSMHAIIASRSNYQEQMAREKEKDGSEILS